MGAYLNPVAARFLTAYNSCHNSGATSGAGVDVEADAEAGVKVAPPPPPPHVHGHVGVAAPYVSVVQHGIPLSRAAIRWANVGPGGHAAQGAGIGAEADADSVPHGDAHVDLVSRNGLDSRVAQEVGT